MDDHKYNCRPRIWVIILLRKFTVSLLFPKACNYKRMAIQTIICHYYTKYENKTSFSSTKYKKNHASKFL